MPEFSDELTTELIDALIALPKMVGRDLCPPLMGATRGEIAGRFWHPSERGELLLVIGEFQGDELIDVIAWRASDPRRWWFRTGHASVLGENHLRSTRFLGEPPIIHPTPEAWARAGGVGSVMLDGDFMRLMEFRRLDVSDDELAAAIDRAHRAPPKHRPKIYVRQPGDSSTRSRGAAAA
jgi:hypothetical protein